MDRRCSWISIGSKITSIARIIITTNQSITGMMRLLGLGIVFCRLLLCLLGLELSLELVFVLESWEVPNGAKDPEKAESSGRLLATC